MIETENATPVEEETVIETVEPIEIGNHNKNSYISKYHSIFQYI